MYYIFNKNGTCISYSNLEPDTKDIESREEFIIESDEVFNISDIYYSEGNIVENPSINLIKEHSWVKSELKLVDTELMYHWTGDIERQSYTEQDWKLYAIALRDYTTIVDGVIVINADSRPISPHNTTLEE